MVGSAIFYIGGPRSSVSKTESGDSSTTLSAASLAGLSYSVSQASILSGWEKENDLNRQINTANQCLTNAQQLGVNDERRELYRRSAQLLIAGVTAIPSMVVALFTGGTGVVPAVLHGINLTIKSLDCAAAYFNYRYSNSEQKYLITAGDSVAGGIYALSQRLRNLSHKINTDTKANHNLNDLYWAKAVSGVTSLLTAYLPLLASQYTPNAASDAWKFVNKAFMYIKVASESVFTLFDVYSGVTAAKKANEKDAAMKTFCETTERLSGLVITMQEAFHALNADKSRDNALMDELFQKTRVRLDAASCAGELSSAETSELIVDIGRLIEAMDPKQTHL